MCDGFEFLTVWHGCLNGARLPSILVGLTKRKLWLFVSEPKIKWKGVREKRERTPTTCLESVAQSRAFSSNSDRAWESSDGFCEDFLDSNHTQQVTSSRREGGKRKVKSSIYSSEENKNSIFRWKFGAQSSLAETKNSNPVKSELTWDGEINNNANFMQIPIDSAEFE